MYSAESNTWMINYKQIQSTTNNYLSGAVNITSTSTAYTKASFGAFMKAGFAMIAALMVFLY